MDGFSVGQDPVTANNNMPNIVKFQTGVYGYKMLSNTISLRETNAPRITVNFTTANSANLQRYYAYVVEDRDWETFYNHILQFGISQY